MEKSEAAEEATAVESEAAQVAEKKVGELKSDLWRLVRLIVDDDDGQVDTYDEAAKALAELKDVTFRSPEVPQHFLCPISCELMRDPVIVASGEVKIARLMVSSEFFVAITRTCIGFGLKC